VILQVLPRQVSIYDHARQRGSFGTGINVLALPIFRRVEASELQQSLAVELILGLEVAVKAAACQALPQP
jgi:hypothetical protein